MSTKLLLPLIVLLIMLVVVGGASGKIQGWLGGTQDSSEAFLLCIAWANDGCQMDDFNTGDLKTLYENAKGEDAPTDLASVKSWCRGILAEDVNPLSKGDLTIGECLNDP